MYISHRTTNRQLFGALLWLAFIQRIRKIHSLSLTPSAIRFHLRLRCVWHSEDHEECVLCVASLIRTYLYSSKHLLILFARERVFSLAFSVLSTSSSLFHLVFGEEKHFCFLGNTKKRSFHIHLKHQKKNSNNNNSGSNEFRK